MVGESVPPDAYVPGEPGQTGQDRHPARAARQLGGQRDLTLDPARLILVGRGGERYAAEVRATATEPDGAFGHVATATFDPVGWTEGFGPEDIAKLNACMKSRFNRVHERVRDWILPVPMEDPGWGRRNERINIARINEIASRVQLENP